MTREAFQKLMNHDFGNVHRVYEQYGAAELCDPLQRGLRALHGRGRKGKVESAGRWVQAKVLGPVSRQVRVADGKGPNGTDSVRTEWTFPQSRKTRRKLINDVYRDKRLTGSRVERRRGVRAHWRDVVEVR